jgi:hypothetical protein
MAKRTKKPIVVEFEMKTVAPKKAPIFDQIDAMRDAAEFANRQRRSVKRATLTKYGSLVLLVAWVALFVYALANAR